MELNNAIIAKIKWKVEPWSMHQTSLIGILGVNGKVLLTVPGPRGHGLHVAPSTFKNIRKNIRSQPKPKRVSGRSKPNSAFRQSMINMKIIVSNTCDLAFFQKQFKSSHYLRDTIRFSFLAWAHGALLR